MSYEKLVNENLKLVHACCHKMTGRGIEYDDLYSAGCIGLVKAAKKFDESLGYKFSTYAVPVILGEIKCLFRENNPIKLSRSLKELSLKIKAETEKAIKQTGKEPTVSVLAKTLGVTSEEIAEAITASTAVKSLDADESISNKASVNQEESMITKISLMQAIDKMENTDKKIIELRYFKDKTQTQTAAALGLTQVQVSRKEKTILNSLRHQLC